MAKKCKNKSRIKLFGLFILFSLAIVPFVSAGNVCGLNVSLINQDPYPAIPNDYVKVVFQVTGLNQPHCEGARFELISSYPFSLEHNDALRILDEGVKIRDYKNDWMIPYELRIDENALDGNPEIEVHYVGLTSEIDSGSSYTVKKFEIKIQDSRTEFDAVIQEVSGNDVSIAIANTGKYAANSVVIRIPEQESFSVTGTNGQMVGNLESGDYTIVGFTVSQKRTVSQNMTRGSPPTDLPVQSDKLKFDVYYTDNIGKRRVVNMELPLNIGNSTITGTGNFAGRGTTSTSSSWSGWYTLLIILVLLAGTYFIYKKYPKQTKEFLNKIKSKIKKAASKKESLVHDKNKVPDWVKNAKEKEKKK